MLLQEVTYAFYLYYLKIWILLCSRPHRAEALSDDALLTSVCLSVAYIGPKSRTERPRKTKTGTEVAHVTRDSDPLSKVKGQLAGGGAYCGGLPHSFCYFLGNRVQRRPLTASDATTG